jgi:hypothetical protein
MGKRAGLEDGLTVRPSALGAGPVEAHVDRAQAGIPGEHGLRQRAADAETLAVLVAPVGRPALTLGVVKEAGMAIGSILPSCPPDVRGACLRAG